MKSEVAFVTGHWVLDSHSYFPQLISEVNGFLAVDCQ